MAQKNNQNKNQQIIRIGNASFLGTIDKKMIQQQPVKHILCQKVWSLNNGGYNKSKFKMSFLFMVECQAQALQLYSNNNTNILKDIHNVLYKNLKILSLSYNTISSIQFLSLIECKNLRTLYLSYNKIRHIKCLKKWTTQYLVQLYLSQNPLSQIDSLTKSKLNSNNQIKLLWLYCKYSESQSHFDLNFVAELNFTLSDAIWLKSTKIINQQKLFSFIDQKYPKIGIKTLP